MLKDPASVLDYKVDWSGWLADDTIDTSSWTVPVGVTKGADSHDDTSATVWLSGGTVDAVYKVTNRITTAAGRTDERSFTLAIRER